MRSIRESTLRILRIRPTKRHLYRRDRRPRRSKAFLRAEGGPRSGGRRLPLSQPYRLTAPLTSGA